MQGTKLKQLQHFLSWNKANIKHSCKSQLYNLPLWLFMTKHPKIDSRLKHEFGNNGKTHSHLNLEVMMNLEHIYL